MAAERRRFPEIDLATERLIEDLVAQGRASIAPRPRLVSVDDWEDLTAVQRRLILVARDQAAAYLGHPGIVRTGSRTKSAPVMYRRTPAQRRSDRRLKYLRRHTSYGQAFGWDRTAHLEAYNYWHLPRRR